MGIGQSKNEENNSMEDIKNLRVDEKNESGYFNNKIYSRMCNENRKVRKSKIGQTII